ncbi:MAG: molybdopterin molybdotransferase MoeA, partial [Candidatus Zixiibacteriota bacterium]
GDKRKHRLKDRHVVKIMTGAPLAAGADAVIPIEYVTAESAHVIIKDKPRAGAFVRPPGNDITAGQSLFQKGEFLTPADIGVLASVGLTEVTVVPRPRIALISTGSEIIGPGEKLEHGQIYDSNMPVLYSLLASDRYPVATQRRVSTNERGPLLKTLRECLGNHDLVISTGAVSMGDYDFIPQIVTALGGDTLFHRVAVKPGKPTLMAGFKDSWLISLPGNPVSSVVGYFLYVRRVVSLLTGVPREPQRAIATLAGELIVRGDRLNIVGARLESAAEGLVAHPAVRQESGRLSSARGINGLIFIEAGDRTLPAGSQVLVELTN